jgi:hypothetical protein
MSPQQEARLFLHRDGQQYGPFPPEQVRHMLALGQVLPTDMACLEGSGDWITVYSIPSMQVQLPPSRPSGSGWGLMISGLVMAVMGAILSATVIGAIIGIPMFIAAIPMVIFGRIKYNKRVMADLKDSVRAGVLQGMQPYGPPQLAAAVTSSTPSSIQLGNLNAQTSDEVPS